MSQQVGPEDDCNWTYPGSNKNVPTIMVLRPTWDEFKDFNKYMKTIEDMGAYKGGIAKVGFDCLQDLHGSCLLKLRTLLAYLLIKGNI